MRRFTYQDDDGTHVVTEQGIKDGYFIYWQQEMKKVGKEHLISFDSCIEDWVAVNWALELPPNEDLVN